MWKEHRDTRAVDCYWCIKGRVRTTEKRETWLISATVWQRLFTPQTSFCPPSPLQASLLLPPFIFMNSTPHNPYSFFLTVAANTLPFIKFTGNTIPLTLEMETPVSTPFRRVREKKRLDAFFFPPRTKRHFNFSRKVAEM